MNQKKHISIVDAIVAGEGNGPEAPESVKAGLLIGGTSPVAVDVTCAKIMGYDWQKIPAIKNAFSMKHYPICNFNYDDIMAVSSFPRFNKKLSEISLQDVFRFKPHFGWVGNIELK